MAKDEREQYERAREIVNRGVNGERPKQAFFWDNKGAVHRVIKESNGKERVEKIDK